ncbi:hypothetical protein EI94DRAFT_1756806 [Lactarius quietus]|nr:hypothetical protein EI94DRAFT_1756806 [Lactarius quietus]
MAPSHRFIVNAGKSTHAVSSIKVAITPETFAIAATTAALPSIEEPELLPPLFAVFVTWGYPHLPPSLSHPFHLQLHCSHWCTHLFACHAYTCQITSLPHGLSGPARCSLHHLLADDSADFIAVNIPGLVAAGENTPASSFQRHHVWLEPRVWHQWIFHI